MLPYFVVLFLSVFLLRAYSKTKFDFLLWATILVLALLLGLRSIAVGTDSEGYASTFFSMNIYSTAGAAANEISTEDGWNVLNWIVYKITPHYWLLFTVVGVFITACAVLLIKKESPVPWLSLLSYITLGFYLFGFAAMRQSVALGIYCIAIPFLLSKNFFKYAIIVIIGSLFHRSILITLPLYFVFNLKYTHTRFIFLIIGSVLFSGLVPQLVASAVEVDSRYNVYLEVHGGGELFAVFYTLMAGFFWTQRAYIRPEKQMRYDTFLMMLVCGAIVYLIITLANIYSEVSRFAMYFQLSIIFLWAELYKNRKRQLSNLFWGLCVAFHVLYYFLYLSKIGEIVPYIPNLSFN